MDGMLMLFEQESYAFGRFLPGFLLPGPLAYSSRTDSFITVSSCQQVESYKYQVLAFATDADERQDTEQQNLSSGKRLVVDWILNIGEQALDICIVSFNQGASSVFVLGERNFFCLKDNGQIRFMKKLDYNPSCFIPYCSVQEGTVNTLIANHSKMLNVYQDVTLKWATQLPCIPVSVKSLPINLQLDCKSEKEVVPTPPPVQLKPKSNDMCCCTSGFPISLHFEGEHSAARDINCVYCI
ncbi:hypothetical protein Nmel_000680 [Mimus melanotis]